MVRVFQGIGLAFDHPMTTKIFLLVILTFFAAQAQSISVASHKNSLFANRVVTRVAQVISYEQAAQARNPGDPTVRPASQSPALRWNDSSWIHIQYDPLEHYRGWDRVPGEQANRNRVSALPRGVESSYQVRLANRRTQIYQTGALSSAQFAVVFVHGAGGNGSLGNNDWSFGGNFNRLKNIVFKSGGVYLSPSFRLNNSGVGVAQAMVDWVREEAGDIPVVFVCASRGSVICDGLLRARYSESRAVDGFIYLGAQSGPSASSSSDYRGQRVPIILAHGSYDPVLPWESMLAVYDSWRRGGYPVQFQLHHGGVHGTPIRLFDWRRGLQWIFSR